MLQQGRVGEVLFTSIIDSPRRERATTSLTLLVRCVRSGKGASQKQKKLLSSWTNSNSQTQGMILDSHAPYCHYNNGSRVQSMVLLGNPK